MSILARGDVYIKEQWYHFARIIFKWKVVKMNEEKLRCF